MYWYRRGCAYADISVFACSQFRDACLLCMREHTYVNVCTQEHGEGGSSSNTMGTTEAELQGTRRASDELKNKSSSDDSKIAELNDRLNKMHEITQARDIKEKALQAEIFESRKDFKDLNLKHKAALALIKQVE